MHADAICSTWQPRCAASAWQRAWSKVESGARGEQAVQIMEERKAEGGQGRLKKIALLNILPRVNGRQRHYATGLEQ